LKAKKFFAIVAALITGGAGIAMAGIVPQAAEAGRMLN
jgi:hypothetical protein